MMTNEKIIMEKDDYHKIRDLIDQIRKQYEDDISPVIEECMTEIEDLLDKAEPFEKYVLNIYKKSSVGDE